jgi:hypothetical protein
MRSNLVYPLDLVGHNDSAVEDAWLIDRPRESDPLDFSNERDSKPR